MTLDEFAKITRDIIARDGFAEFQPTACFPERKSVAVLAGVPDGVDVEAAALAWSATKSTPGEEVLVVFKVAKARFKIVRRKGAESNERTFDLE